MRRARLRWLGLTALIALALGGVFVGAASTAGPGGWDHIGTNGAGGTSLNLTVNALNADAPGQLLVGGVFTDAGGDPAADFIASWNGSRWSAVNLATELLPPGGVYAIENAGGKIYAGGNFTDGGGPKPDYLAVWTGTTWSPFCNGPQGLPAIGGNVKALQAIGGTLYVGGEFQNPVGILNGDYLLACDLSSGAASSTFTNQNQAFSGPVYALADSNGVLYAGGGFSITNDQTVRYVSYFAGGVWHPMGTGAAGCTCAVNDFVRSLVAVGPDVYVGTDFKNVAGIAQADHVARWNGTAWSALGADTSGADGWFTGTTSINALTSHGAQIYAAGSFQNANGESTADVVAAFDGSSWHPVGSSGAGEGPLNAQANALTVFGNQLIAGGSFTVAGGDTLARSVASFALAQVTPQPTPTVTPSATPVATPVATPTPMPQPTPTPTPTPDITKPRITSLRLSSTTFKAATSGPPFRAAAVRVGAFVSFTLSEPGSVRFTIDRSTTGRTMKGRCVKTASSNRGKPSCKRWVVVKGSFVVPGKKGANRIELRGRLNGKTLTPGSYRLNARETDRGANRSAIKRTAFRIVR
jgi:hypothetical protein